MKNMMYLSKMIMAAVLILAVNAAAQPIVWFDGSHSDQPPQGKLLTDNEDYWGEVVLTGVTYGYQTTPNAPADNRVDRLGRTGRVLFNGGRGPGVGLGAGQPLVVIFDFQRPCTFTEWDVITPSGQVAITLEIRNEPSQPWQTVYQQTRQDSAESQLQRLMLGENPQGRYARLSVQAAGATQLREVLAWGNAEVTETLPEEYQAVVEIQYPVGVAFQTVPGVNKSNISDRESFYWLESLTPQQRQQPAVWSQIDPWDSISNRPLQPAAETINQPIDIVMARNETENIALVLKSTSVDSPREVTVEMGAFHDNNNASASNLKGSLGVMGVIPSLNSGINLGPIFEADNLLGRSLMRKYLLNGPGIVDFPQITLSPSGTAVLWLSVTSNDAAAGHYQSSIQIADGQQVPVRIEVLDVELPSGPFALVGAYSTNVTDMWPFTYADRLERDVNYALDCGLSQWTQPAEGTASALARQLAQERDMELMYYIGHVVPGIFVHNAYCGIWTTAQDLEGQEQAVAEHITELVQRAEELGLDYDQWYGSTGDEPGPHNLPAIGRMCQLVKQADPRVNIYINPCGWVGWDNGAVPGDEEMVPALEGWYNDAVDISMPLFLLLENRPESMEYFAADRLVNTYYYVSTHLSRSESRAEVELHRRMAWDSFDLNFEGWSFYSYYSPRGSAWVHHDRHPRGEGLQEPSDYQMVYPGPKGVIPTRHSEALREGWEDWRLLNLLRSQGQEQLLADLMQRYHDGEELISLRREALQAAAASE